MRPLTTPLAADGAAPIVMLPGGVLVGARLVNVISKNLKSFGSALQVSGVLAPSVPLTLTKFRLKSTPEPDSGAVVLLSPFIRSVFVVLLHTEPVGQGVPMTLHIPAPAVNPAVEAAIAWKSTTVGSKVKSP